MNLACGYLKLDEDKLFQPAGCSFCNYQRVSKHHIISFGLIHLRISQPVGNYSQYFHVGLVWIVKSRCIDKDNGMTGIIHSECLDVRRARSQSVANDFPILTSSSVHELRGLSKIIFGNNDSTDGAFSSSSATHKT